jgi:putative molybdopterin biosynthesis protein
MKHLLSTKEVAQHLHVNEKMVYALVADKGLPATKITGKWLFPKHLVDQWVEANTVNTPESASQLPPYDGLLVMAGSNDLLLERSLAMFNAQYPDHLAVYGNLGSMGGMRSLKYNRCHIAFSHLLQDDEREYNFEFAFREFGMTPVVVNFCHREQGLMLSKGNPLGISGISDLDRPGIRIVNRPLGTGTRLLFDRELRKAGLRGEKIEGYDTECHRHMDVGLEVLAGRADVAPGIRPVAALLGLDFLPLRWERFDLLVSKNRFFDQGVQLYLGLLHEPVFTKAAQQLDGYDLRQSGKMVFASA